MLLDDPVNECLVRVLLLTIVGNCEFHRSASWHFRHLYSVLVYSIWPEKILNLLLKWGRGGVVISQLLFPGLFIDRTDVSLTEID